MKVFEIRMNLLKILKYWIMKIAPNFEISFIILYFILFLMGQPHQKDKIILIHFDICNDMKQKDSL